MTVGLLQAYGLAEEGAGTCSLRRIYQKGNHGKSMVKILDSRIDQLRVRYDISTGFFTTFMVAGCSDLLPVH